MQDLSLPASGSVCNHKYDRPKQPVHTKSKMRPYQALSIINRAPRIQQMGAQTWGKSGESAPDLGGGVVYKGCWAAGRVPIFCVWPGVWGVGHSFLGESATSVSRLNCSISAPLASVPTPPPPPPSHTAPHLPSGQGPHNRVPPSGSSRGQGGGVRQLHPQSLPQRMRHASPFPRVAPRPCSLEGALFTTNDVGRWTVRVYNGPHQRRSALCCSALKYCSHQPTLCPSFGLSVVVLVTRRAVQDEGRVEWRPRKRGGGGQRAFQSVAKEEPTVKCGTGCGQAPGPPRSALPDSGVRPETVSHWLFYSNPFANP